MPFMLIFALVFLGLAGLLVLLTYGIGRAIKWQANKPIKRFFAPIPRPGSFSFVALEGKIVEVIESVVGWRLKEVNEADCFALGKREESGVLEHFLGVRWIGFFATIAHFPKWIWSEFQQVERVENGQKVLKYEIILRGPEDVSEFFFQFPYPVITDNAEIKGNIMVKITAVLTVLHLHPTRAFFLNKDPVALFNAMIQSAFRSYVTEMNFDDVKAIKASPNGDDGEDKTFWKILKKLNGIELDKNGNPIYENEDPLGLFGKLGFYVARAEVVQVDGVGATAVALEAKRIAELQGDAEIAAAEKSALALIAAAKGRMNASGLDALAQRTLNEQNAGYYASLPGGSRMFVADRVASKESDVTTWVEGNSDIKVTLPLPTPPKPQKPEQRQS